MAVECRLRQKAGLSIAIPVTDTYELLCDGAAGRAGWSWVHSVIEKDVIVPGPVATKTENVMLPGVVDAYVRTACQCVCVSNKCVMH